MLVELEDGISMKVKTLPIDKFCKLFGYTKGQIQGKVYPRNKEQEPIWTEGKQYVRDPDGRLHILLDGYEAWVMSKSIPTPRPLFDGNLGRNEVHSDLEYLRTKPGPFNSKNYKLK